MNYADYYNGGGGGGYQPPQTPYGQHPYQSQYGGSPYRQYPQQVGYQGGGGQGRMGYRPNMGGGGGYGGGGLGYGPSVEGGKDRVPYPGLDYGPDSMNWGRPGYGRRRPRYQLRYKSPGQTSPAMPYDPYQGGGYQQPYNPWWNNSGNPYNF